MYYFKQFLQNEHGAVSVDYTVISAAAVGMAIAATAVLTGGIDYVTSRIDEELRDRQLNDTFIAFESAHFEPLYAFDIISEEDAEDFWNVSNEQMNQELLDDLEANLTKLLDGTINEAELIELYADASVAYQRNILDDAILEPLFDTDTILQGSGDVSVAFN